MPTKLTLLLAAICMAIALAALWPVIVGDANAPFRISRGYGHTTHSHSGGSSHSHYGRA